MQGSFVYMSMPGFVMTQAAGNVTMSGPGLSMKINSDRVTMGRPGCNMQINSGNVTMNRPGCNMQINSGDVTMSRPGCNMQINSGDVTMSRPGCNMRINSGRVTMSRPGCNMQITPGRVKSNTFTCNIRSNPAVSSEKNARKPAQARKRHVAIKGTPGCIITTNDVSDSKSDASYTLSDTTSDSSNDTTSDSSNDTTSDNSSDVDLDSVTSKNIISSIFIPGINSQHNLNVHFAATSISTHTDGNGIVITFPSPDLNPENVRIEVEQRLMIVFREFKETANLQGDECILRLELPEGIAMNNLKPMRSEGSEGNLVIVCPKTPHVTAATTPRGSSHQNRRPAPAGPPCKPASTSSRPAPPSNHTATASVRRLKTSPPPSSSGPSPGSKLASLCPLIKQAKKASDD